MANKGLMLEFRPTSKQLEVVKFWSDKETEEIAYGGSKGGGKSFLGCVLIFSDALTYPKTNYFIARQELNDLRKFTIPSIYEVFDKWGLVFNDYCKYHGTDNYFTLYNGSRVYLLHFKYLPNDPLYERFGSMQFTRGWIEEAGEANDLAAANLSLSVGRWKNKEYGLDAKLLYTCNPKKNFLYRDFYKPFKSGELPKSKKFVQAFVWDNPHIPQAYKDKLKNTRDKTMYQRLYLGNWEYADDENTLFEYDSLIDAYSNNFIQLAEKNNPKSKRYMSCDVALDGRDKAVITIREGWAVYELIEIDKSQADELEAKLKELATAHKIPRSRIVFDADGVGAFLKGYLKGAISFLNGSKAINKENYENLRAQCYYMLAEKFNDRTIFLGGKLKQKQEEITEELEAIKKKDIDSDGKRKVIQRKEIVRKLRRSPDIASSLMMHCYFDLKNTFKSKTA